jgi:hypothetical protein
MNNLIGAIIILSGFFIGYYLVGPILFDVEHNELIKQCEAELSRDHHCKLIAVEIKAQPEE